MRSSQHKLQKLATAVGVALGSVGGAGVPASDIQNMTFEDWDGDNIAGGFNFAAGQSTVGKLNRFFDSSASVTFTPAFGAPVMITPSNTMGITADGNQEGTATFTAGFIFSGGVPMTLSSYNAVGETGDPNANQPDNGCRVVSMAALTVATVVSGPRGPCTVLL